MKIGDYNSLFITNALSRTQSAIARSLQRLSKGLRVNSPQDDPAAFSEAVNLQSQIRGSTQAILNINNAQSLLLTADGGISSQLQILQKMRELAVQASNGTLSTQDRSELNLQMQQLLAEYSRVSTSTNFNGLNILDGSFGTTNIQVGANSLDNFGVATANTTANSSFTKTVGSGSFNSQTSYAAGSSHLTWQPDIATGDLNGDGIPDLVKSNNSTDGTISILFGKGDGTFQAQQTLSAAQNLNGVGIADLNGDGVNDIYVADSGEISVYLGNGNGTFKPRTTYKTGSGTLGVIAADLNGDGKMDLVAADETDNTLSILIGNGDGTFKSRTTLATGNGPWNLAIGDINGDGKLDLVDGDDTDGTVSIFLGNGNGTFRSRTTMSVPTGNQVWDVHLADMDGDGKLDLIMSNRWTNPSLIVSYGNGDGTFGNSVIASVPSDVANLSVGDINGDGKLDIVGGNAVVGALFEVLNNGGRSFQPYRSITGSGNWATPALVDVNKDGVLDLVSAFDNGTIGIFTAQTQTATALSDLNLTSAAQSSKAISVLDTAINYVESQRATIGAEQNRLGLSLSFAQSLNQNLSDARSRALDVDIALETSQLVRNQILEQVQVAMVGQANVNTQMVLGLLKTL